MTQMEDELDGWRDASKGSMELCPGEGRGTRQIESRRYQPLPLGCPFAGS